MFCVSQRVQAQRQAITKAWILVSHHNDFLMTHPKYKTQTRSH